MAEETAAGSTTLGPDGTADTPGPPEPGSPGNGSDLSRGGTPTAERAAARRGAVASGWRLRRRLGVTYTVAAVMLLIVGGLVVGSLVRLQSAIHTRSDVLAPALLTSTQIVSSLVDQETGMRGYLLQGSKDFLEPYDAGRTAERQQLADLHRRLADRPELVARLTVLENRIGAWHRDYADPAINGVRMGGPAAARLLSPEFGKARFDAVRAAAADLGSAVRAEAVQARSNVSDALRFLIIALSIGAFVMVALLTVIARALRSWVTRPIEQVSGDARTVASGHLDHVVATTGPPDIATLAADVESMRLQLLGELGVARAARSAVETQAEVLRRSNRDLEQFAYVASHDLQEPLRKVASFCQLLERRYGDKLDERGVQYIAFAVDGAKRMQQLINDLLAFSRVGRTTDSFVEVPLTEALGRATAALSIMIENLHGEITADELPTVRGDPVLLTQLFANLIGNALKFHGDEVPRVHIGLIERADDWEMSCVDNGIGIDPEYAEKIFVIFQRLHSRDVYEGTGIGLALCRKIIEFHGGRIWLDSTSGTGTTFRWTLPKTPVVTPAEDPAALLAGAANTPAAPAGANGSTPPTSSTASAAPTGADGTAPTAPTTPASTASSGGSS